ncbi:unnamed protein product [Urochloa humidicola]
MDMMPKITEFGLKICLGTGTNGIVKYNGRIVLADNIYRLLCFEYMPKGNLGMHLSDDHHPKFVWRTRFNTAMESWMQLLSTYEELCHVDSKPANVLFDENMVAKIADFGLAKQERNMRSSIRIRGYAVPEFMNNEGIIPIKSDVYSFTTVVLLEILTGRLVGYSKRSEMSPEEFSGIVYENWRNRWKFESSSKQIKRSNQIVISCLESGKSMKATSRTGSSTQRAVLDFIAPVIAAQVMLLVFNYYSSELAAALSVHHLYRSNLTEERSNKPCTNRAPETNSSNETTQAPMANKLTDDEAENHSDPNSCVAERDIIEKAKRYGEWYVATGAAHHATGNPDLITNMLELENGGLSVQAADGTPMPVCGRGNVVTDAVVLPDVYYVPGLCTNLVSVGQLAGLDYSVGFGRGTCIVSSPDGTVVGGAHARGDGLYEVDFLRVPLDIL